MPRHSFAAFALPIRGSNTFHPSPEKKEKRSGGAQKEKKRKERRRVELRDRWDFVACGLSLRLLVRPRASSLRTWGPVSLSVYRGPPAHFLGLLEIMNKVCELDGWMI
jgi:hypothetical protein